MKLRRLTPAFITGVVWLLLLGSSAFTAWGQPMAPLPAQVTVTSGQNPVSAAQTVTFTATVGSVLPNAGVPTGTVEFFAGPLSMGKATLASTNGSATASITVQMQPGRYPVLARYYGDGTFAFGVSVPPLTQQVLGQ